MTLLVVLGQIALGLPFIVFAYWYHCQEVIYRSIMNNPAEANLTFWHAVFVIFISLSFGVLAVLFFPPATEVVTLISSLFILVRALDVIENGWSQTPLRNKWNVFKGRFLHRP